MRALALIVVLVATPVPAESNLPACTGSDSSRWSNCTGNIGYPNGDRYVGEFRFGLPNGRGTMTFTNGDKYVGEFRDGMRQDNGLYISVDGRPPNISGRTSSTPMNADFITANVSAQSNLPACLGSNILQWDNCFGVRTFSTGDKYVGEWMDGKRNGLGTFIWPNGNKYVGEFRDYEFNGQGIKTFADGSPPQEGIWKNYRFVRAQRIADHIAGRTPLTPPSDTIVATTVSAQSNLPACQGSDYTQWSNCVGTYTWPNGDKYVGEFNDGKLHGRGTYYYLADNQFKGDAYVGEFRGNKRNGQGSMTFTNGDKYVGEFRDDKFHGRGTYSSVNGRAPPMDQRLPAHVTSSISSPPTTVVIAPRETEVTVMPWAVIFSGMPTVHICNYLRSTMLSSSDRQLALAEMQRRPNESCAPNLNITGVQNASPAQPALPRQAEVTRSTLNLAASASSPDSNGVLTLNITTNSDTASLRINRDEVGSRADGRYSVQRFAQIGTTNFEVIATDRFGNTQIKTILVSRQAADNTVRFASLNPIAVRARPATNAVAIIIGIQDYRRVSKAEFANNDARVFYDYAVRGLGVRPENIKLLVDQEADQVEVLSAFKNWLPLKTRKGLTDVYVFYSGHGLPSDDGSNLYMLPHGVDRQFLNETAIKQSVLIAALQATSPRSVTMFMDACYSGQSRTGETLLASARPISIQSKASSYPANFSVISASSPDQLASSSPDLKHGVFSYFLMKGMEGEADENKDGNITMAEMQSYLKEYVGKKAMSLNRTQVPQITGDQSRVLVSR